jgi:hypothetical protein
MPTARTLVRQQGLLRFVSWNPAIHPTGLQFGPRTRFLAEFSRESYRVHLLDPGRAP